MFDYINSLSLRIKLLGSAVMGLSFVLLLSLAGLALAWTRLTDEVPPQVTHANLAERISNDFRLEVQEWKNVLLRGADAGSLAKHLKAFREHGNSVAKETAELAAVLSTPDSKQLVKRFAEEHAALQKVYEDAIAGSSAGTFDGAMLDRQVVGKDRAASATVEALVELTAKQGHASVSDKASEARKAIAWCAGLALLAAIALIAITAWYIGTAVLRPLDALAKAGREMAAGDLSANARIRSKDEIGQVAAAFSSLQVSLASMRDAQAQMSARHASGHLSYRMDPAPFAGDFSQMIRDTNGLVDAQVQLIDEMLAVAKAYSIGDLSKDMSDLPGEKAVITEAMRAIRDNLGSINREITHLVHSAAAGDFSARGDAQAHQHDFRDMVVGLNQLMSNTQSNLDGVSRVLRSLARGDLTSRLGNDAQGVFAQMRDDANATTLQLAEIVGEIQSAADAITSAAGEIAAGNSDLAQRTEQQAASLEETSATMEELTVTVRQNAQHATSAATLAGEAAVIAGRGGEVAERMIDTMQQIETSSQRIAEIISVIDGIAFQTNILALNAAVEAARAGEQGRGFAVVAGEVRALAQRSASAAKEIKTLIESSTASVTAGSTLVGETGSTMKQIVQSVNRVTGIMDEIAAASREQTAGIEQVSRTVMGMDESTQQNAALVEEATASAASLEEQARGLVSAVAVFKLQSAPEQRRAA